VTFREGTQLAGTASNETDLIASARAFMAAETRFNTAAAEGRKAPPPPAPETPRETGPSPAEIRAAEEKAVRTVVERYRQAYNNLDADAVAAVFPSGPIAQLRSAWGGVQQQTVTFANLNVRLDDAATTATVTATAETVMQPRGGSSQRATAPMTLTLRKNGDNWVITERR
jgi:ketosteroid isomerase-like protein